MAKSGTVKQYVTADRYIYLLFEWEILTQSTVNNYSTIAWNLKLVSSHVEADILSSQPKAMKININGKQIRNTAVTVNLNGGQTRTLASGQETITHSNDGSKIFPFNFSQQFDINYHGANVGTITGSGSGTLDVIPRATTPKATSTSQELGKEIVFSLPRASGSFTHTLKYRFNKSSAIIGENLGTSAKWTPPLALARQITDGKSGVCVITCNTYNGDDLVGTKTIDITLKVPSTMTPTINAVTFTEKTPGIASKFGKFIKDQSIIEVDVDASADYDATIKTYKVEFLGLVYTKKTFTTPIVNQSGTITCKVTVKDSRGFSKTGTFNASVLDYVPPSIHTFEAERCDADGTLNEDGDHVSIALNLAITTLENKNDKTYIIQYKRTTDEAFMSLVSGSSYLEDKVIVPTQIFDTDKSYILALTVSDFFNDAKATEEIETAFTLFDVADSGKGFALGKVSEDDTFDVNLQAKFRKDVQFKDDTEWKNLTLDAKFKPYGDDAKNTPKYRIRGKVVEIRGAVSPKTAYDSTFAKVPFAVLPQIITPEDDIVQLCPGSNKDTWTLHANADGTLSVAQYGSTQYGTVSVNSRLWFQIVYTI